MESGAYKIAERFLIEQPNDPEAFERMLYSCLRYGYVFASPGKFLAFHATQKDLPIEDQRTPGPTVVVADTWFLMAAKAPADYVEFLKMAPYPMSYVAFEVAGRYHIYPTDKIQEVVRKLDRQMRPRKVCA